MIWLAAITAVLAVGVYLIADALADRYIPKDRDVR